MSEGREVAAREFGVSPSAAVAEFSKRGTRGLGAAQKASLIGCRGASDDGPACLASEFNDGRGGRHHRGWAAFVWVQAQAAQ